MLTRAPRGEGKERLAGRLFCAVAMLGAILAVFPEPTQAQSAIVGGVKGGYTSAIFQSNLDMEVQERRAGVAMFAFVEWRRWDILSVLVEAGYTQRGYVTRHRGFTPDGETFVHKVDNRFDYISTATLVRARLARDIATPYLIGGPRLDHLVGAKPDNLLSRAYRDWAAGLTVGAGVEAGILGALTLFVEARYDVDFTNSLAGYPRTAYNNAMDVFVGFVFGP